MIELDNDSFIIVQTEHPDISQLKAIFQIIKCLVNNLAMKCKLLKSF